MAEGLIWLFPIFTTANQADGFIKALPRFIFKLFRSVLEIEQVDIINLVNTPASKINRS